MSNQTKQRPVETLRDGSVKAAIWKNEGENGTFYNVTFARTYISDGNIKDTDSFSGTQLLRLSRLAEKAYDRVAELNKEAQVSEDNQEDSEGEA